MEFESENTKNQVSDEARRLAESKKIILQPIHGDVMRERTIDAIQFSRVMPTEDAADSIERETSYIQPSRELRRSMELIPGKGHTRPFAISLSILGLSIITITLLYFIM